MPKLERKPNWRPTTWVVRLTKVEDTQAARELGLVNKVNCPLSDGNLARRVLDAVNNRANQIRNPPGR